MTPQRRRLLSRARINLLVAECQLALLQNELEPEDIARLRCCLEDLEAGTVDILPLHSRATEDEKEA